MPWVGVGYRAELAKWIETDPTAVSCLEITAEHFFDRGEAQLKSLSERYPLFVHGLGLSLGTPGPLEQATLDQFAHVVEIARPQWISEHVAFTRSSEVDLGHLNPIHPTDESLAVISDHACEVSERCGKPILLENITSYLRLDGGMSEAEFLNRLCERARCGLLLDVTNLFINSKNHGFDARAWLHELDPKLIVQLHIVGYTQQAGRWHDRHSEDVQEDLLDLLYDVLDYAPVQAAIIERDNNFPSTDQLTKELTILERAIERHRPYNSTSETSQ